MLYNKYSSRQCNLTAEMKPVQDKYTYTYLSKKSKEKRSNINIGMHKLGNIIEVNNPSYLCKKDKTKKTQQKWQKNKMLLKQFYMYD